MNHTQENVYIGREIRTQRKLKRMTQKDLADKLGIKDNTISAYERGTIEIPRSRLIEIAHVLDVKYMELLPPDIDNNELMIIKHIAALNNTLDNDQLTFLDALIEKTLSLDESKRVQFLKNISVAIKVFDE